MKKYILLFFLQLSLLFAFANPVDTSTTRTIADNFWVANGGSKNVEWIDITAETSFTEFRIWSNEQGFVIVSSDDCVIPILGYSLNNTFQTPIPEHVASYLERLSQEISYWKSQQNAPNRELVSLWLSLTNGSYAPQATTAVSPMLTTTWGQDPYYNNLCPSDNGELTVAGCVATATTQIMKYWNWPKYGNGSHSYTHDTFGTLTANFGNTTYLWEQMPNELTSSSTTQQIEAVAQLMYHFGVAIEMDYDVSGSGAHTHNYAGTTSYPCPQNALREYFNYKSTIHSVYKANVSDDTWTSTIKNELDAGRPVLHSGRDDAGGHAFVCDGYDNNNLFHINWGWSGYCDGYYALNSLSPQAGGTGGNATYTFNQDRGVVVGIEPNKTLHANTNSLSLPKSGSTSTFCVTSGISSSNWTATCSQSWLTLSATSGTGYGTMTKVTATATTNNTGATRTAVITLSQGGSTWTINVIQNECLTSEMCSITLEMSDSYGDSWNGASVTISSTSGYNYGTYTCISGSFATETINICPSDIVISWNSGNYDSECSFVVKNALGNTILNVSSINYSSWTIPSPCANMPTVGCLITEFPWTEGFENNGECWNIIDADGDGSNWFLATGLPNSGTYSIASYSYNNNESSAMSANNYLISPRITLPSDGHYSLFFHARSASASYPDSLSVKLSTATNITTSSFTTTLMPQTCINTATYQQYSIDLTNYGGQTVRLAFVHQSYDGYFISLDDISIVNVLTDYNITVNASDPSMGSTTGSGTFAPSSQDTLTAIANSNYRFTGWSDGNTQNPRYITVTADASYTAIFADLGNDVLQYDNGELNINLGVGSGFYWAVQFPANELTDYIQLPAIRIFNKEAGTYEVKIYQGGTNYPYYLKATDTFALTGTNSWVDCTLSEPVALNTTQNLWVVIYNSDVSYPATASNYCGNRNGSWVSFNGFTWNTLDALGHYNTWMVRALLSQDPIPARYYTINVSSNDATQGTTTGSGSYEEGTQVTISAAPVNHYHFTQWNDGNTMNPRTVTVTGNVNYTAYFAIDQHQITVNSNDPTAGTVTGGGTYNYGAQITITATPDSHHHFTQWSDGNTQNPRTITISADATYTAQFAANQYQVSVNSNNSTMGSATGGGTYDYGTQITLSATAAAHHHFTQWNDGNTMNPRTVTVTGNVNYTAYFAIDQHQITVNSNDPTAGTVTGGGTYNYGAQITITATADSHHYFTQWSDGNTQNPRTITISGDAIYTAQFAANQYQVSVTSNDPTMGSVSGGGTFDYGTQIALTAMAENHYHFTQWNDGNTQNPRIVTVTENVNYTAYFATNQYQITVNSNDPTMGNVSGGGTFDYGTQIIISATANGNYSFTNWSDGNTDNPRTIIVNGPATYTANFHSTIGIDDIDIEQIIICSIGHQIIIKNAQHQSIEIYDMTGRMIVAEADNDQAERSYSIGTNGIYLVSVGNKLAKKVTVCL